MATLIKLRHRGSYVADIQILLNNESRLSFSAYGPLVEDGVFGQKTKQRVEEWQMFNGLQADGIVGPVTWHRMFHGVMPAVVVAAADAANAALLQGVKDGITNAKAEEEFRKRAATFKPIALYLHGYDAPDAMKDFDHLADKESHHIKIRKGHLRSMLLDGMEYLLDKERSLTDLVINTHGAGSGTLKIGKDMARLAEFAEDLSMLRTYVKPGANMWIYACCFAIHEFPDSSLDADNVYPDEMHPPEVDDYDNIGLRSLKAIARRTNMTVHAGFASQFGTTGGFVGPWVSCTPQERIEYKRGRTLDRGETIGLKSKQIGHALSFVLSKF